MDGDCRTGREEVMEDSEIRVVFEEVEAVYGDVFRELSMEGHDED